MQMEASLPGASSICSDGSNEAREPMQWLFLLNKDHRLHDRGEESQRGTVPWTKVPASPAECEEQMPIHVGSQKEHRACALGEARESRLSYRWSSRDPSSWDRSCRGLCRGGKCRAHCTGLGTGPSPAHSSDHPSQGCKGILHLHRPHGWSR